MKRCVLSFCIKTVTSNHDLISYFHRAVCSILQVYSTVIYANQPANCDKNFFRSTGLPKGINGRKKNSETIFLAWATPYRTRWSKVTKLRLTPFFNFGNLASDPAIEFNNPIQVTLVGMDQGFKTVSLVFFELQAKNRLAKEK